MICCAIQAGTGQVVCWGSNYHGQASPPAAVDGSEGRAAAIAAGYFHTLAIAAPEPAADLLGPACIGALALAARRRIGTIVPPRHGTPRSDARSRVPRTA